jgi:hypothetical protein
MQGPNPFDISYYVTSHNGERNKIGPILKKPCSTATYNATSTMLCEREKTVAL